jgi:hypothetical protein
MVGDETKNVAPVIMGLLGAALIAVAFLYDAPAWVYFAVLFGSLGAFGIYKRFFEKNQQ